MKYPVDILYVWKAWAEITKEICKNWSRVLKTDTGTMVFRNKEKEAVSMSYILQTNHLTKKIEGKELVRAVNIHVKKEKSMDF